MSWSDGILGTHRAVRSRRRGADRVRRSRVRSAPPGCARCGPSILPPPVPRGQDSTERRGRPTRSRRLPVDRPGHVLRERVTSPAASTRTTPPPCASRRPLRPAGRFERRLNGPTRLAAQLLGCQLVADCPARTSVRAGLKRRDRGRVPRRGRCGGQLQQCESQIDPYSALLDRPKTQPSS